MVEVALPYNYTPHCGQVPFHAAAARMRVLACGARWGKDRASINDLIMRCGRIYGLREPDPTLIPFVHAWIVAPTFGLARQSWAELKAFTPPEIPKQVNESLQTMRWKWDNGDVLIEVKSADDPQRLVSVGLDYLLMTEASLVAERAWLEALRPRLASPKRAGLAVLNGTPRGRNWFYKLYLLGQDPAEVDYASWNEPTASNPYIVPAEIERMRREMPDRYFRQEVLAEFLSDAGGVFRGVRAAIREDVQAQGDITVGVDWAQVNDFTVFTAMQGGHVIDFDRMNQVGWELQCGRLKAFCSRFEPGVLMPESNSMGGPLVERLEAEMHGTGWTVEGFTTTQQSKRQLIDHLTLGIENGEVTYPDLPQLVNELEAYEYVTTTAGNVRTQAPSNYHDDCVMSLALAYWAQEHGGRAWTTALRQRTPDCPRCGQVVFDAGERPLVCSRCGAMVRTDAAA